MAKNGKSHDTPAMRQFRHFKEKYPQCVLFFRMGDFYETFYDDAKLIHKVLGVTLTQRTEGIPMAGVPYHSVEGYLRRVIEAGYRVAVCEQMEDPSQAKGVVRREVTRVITPGTLTDESLLEEGRENPLAAVQIHDTGKASIAWAELSTGAFSLVTVEQADLADELARIAPRELLVGQEAGEKIPSSDRLPDRPNPMRHHRTAALAISSKRSGGRCYANSFKWPRWMALVYQRMTLILASHLRSFTIYWKRKRLPAMIDLWLIFVPRADSYAATT